MKFLIVSLVGLSAAFGGVKFFSNPLAAPTKPSVEVVSIPSNSSTTSTPTTTNEAPAATKAVERHSVNKDRVLYLTSEVNYATVNQLVNQLKELNTKSTDPVYLLIDSPGGSVLDGATLLSEMEASKAPVYTVCTRLCASMAAMIHSYGKRRLSTDRSILMYHPASGGAQGQVPNMLSQLLTINSYLEKMVGNIVARSKVSKADYDRLVAYEIWIDAEDAKAKGMTDAIVNLNVPNSASGGSGSSRESVEPTKQPTEIQWIAPESERHLWDRK